MIIKPGDFPGSHERHLLRKANNLPFEDQQPELTDDALLEAQRHGSRSTVGVHG